MNREIKFSNEKLVSLYKDLEGRLGSQPTKKQWIEDSKTPNDMPIRQRFGNWSNFLNAMGLSCLKWVPTKNGVTRRGTRNKYRKRIKNHNGYIEVFEPSHPTAKANGYCLEHRKLAWDNRILKDLNMQVHHINEIKDDNRLCNLQSIAIQDHTIHHHKGAKRTRKNSKKCLFKKCFELTSSQYGLCRKHYKLQWQRVRSGLIGNIHQHPPASRITK